MSTCSPTALVQSSVAFAGLDGLQMRMVIVQLLCDISGAAGGSEGGAGNSILSGPSSPVNSVSAVGPAIYIQDNGTIWALPAGGNSSSWVIASAPSAPPPPPPPAPLDFSADILAQSDRLAGFESRIGSIDDLLKSTHEGIGTLHQAVTQSATDYDLKQAMDPIHSEIATLSTTTRKLREENEELRTLLARTVKLTDLEKIQVEIGGIMKTITVPCSKLSLWKKLRNWSLNLFA